MRFIVNATDLWLQQDTLEVLMSAWERSPYPPAAELPKLTPLGAEHARQQLLKEHLKAKRSDGPVGMAARIDDRIMRGLGYR